MLILTDTVKDIEQIVKQPHELLTIKENATIAEAAKKMNNNNVGCLVVFDMKGKFTGVLTERDILSKVTTTHVPPQNLLVGQIMTADPISCSMDYKIEEVEQLMAEHKIRHVPVVTDGTPVGMVSSRDVIAYRLQSSKAMKSAAEQIALLSTVLKSLNLKEVVSLAIEEVPKSFDAVCAVLCFAQNPSPNLVIHRSGCTLSRKNLLAPKKIKELSKNDRIIYGSICDECNKLGAKAPRLVIPLNIYDQSDDNINNDTYERGFLCMCRFRPCSIDEEKLRLYKASLLQAILSVNLTNAKLHHNYQQARRDSETDPLTGVGTRRVLEQVLKDEYARSVRYNRPFSLAIIDLDNFKEINDTAGHAAGDKALRQLAKFMRINARMTDTIIARYGGDEFVLLMPETKLSDANILLERLRQQVKTISLPTIDSITISCGLAEWNGSPDDTAELILKRADNALYEAKRAGRNRIVANSTPVNTQ
ncbi:MAG: diguanylate cyclase [Planctomycetota bacterium]|jgi:diguanylate cyclase (GGDEF)-like protein